MERELAKERGVTGERLETIWTRDQVGVSNSVQKGRLLAASASLSQEYYEEYNT